MAILTREVKRGSRPKERSGRDTGLIREARLVPRGRGDLAPGDPLVLLGRPYLVEDVEGVYVHVRPILSAAS